MVTEKASGAVYQSKVDCMVVSSDEIVSLYFFLGEQNVLPEKLERILEKLERDMFSSYTVKEIETLRNLYIKERI